MEGLLSIEPTPSSLPYTGEDPMVHWSASGICSGLHYPGKKWSLPYMLSYHRRGHTVNNKGKYWRCLKFNLTTPLKISTMFYKTKLLLLQFVMMLYCFTELNIRNTQKRNKSPLPKKNKDYDLFSIGH